MYKVLKWETAVQDMQASGHHLLIHHSHIFSFITLYHNRPHRPRRQRREDVEPARDKICRLLVEQVDQALIRP